MELRWHEDSTHTRFRQYCLELTGKALWISNGPTVKAGGRS